MCLLGEEHQFNQTKLSKKSMKSQESVWDHCMGIIGLPHCLQHKGEKERR